MVEEFSEVDGYFLADNFTSNETGYLEIVDKLKELKVTGGAYIGVGPEQNFTYIAKVRPSIAFIVDIRRQAILQHLLYKAIFHLAPSRAEFLSLLFSRPLSETRSEAKGPVEDLLNYISGTPTTKEQFSSNLAVIRKTIEKDFAISLSREDVGSLEYVYYFFWLANLRIAYGYGFPTLRDLILATDLNGEMGNFLAREDDYRFVRELEERNRVIPIVGDFAGTKALTAVADYLRTYGYEVSAFYTSNVEEYLYGDDEFGKFAENVRKLPVSGRSVFIRSLRSNWALRHPASFPDTTRMTLLESIPVFLDDFKKGLYPTYRSLMTTHYISASESQVPDPPAPESH